MELAIKLLISDIMLGISIGLVIGFTIIAIMMIMGILHSRKEIKKIQLINNNKTIKY